MPEPKPILRGRMTWLRAPRRIDFTETWAAVSDADTAHGMGLRYPVGPDDAGDFAQVVLSQQGKTLYGFTISPLGEDRPIGFVSLRDIDRENGSAELTIAVFDPAYQDRGYGTDAVNCIVDFGFGELRLERVYLHVFDYNARAIRAYQKAGFQTDAVMRHARFHRGSYGDVHVMSILRDEWRTLDRPRAWEQAG